MAILSLITAALEGLAALPKILDEIKKLLSDNRLNEIEAAQKQMGEAFLSLASAKTQSEKDAAILALTKSINP
jgi:hypothetical protein